MQLCLEYAVNNADLVCYRVDLGPYLPSIELGLIGLTVYISYCNNYLARLLIILHTFTKTTIHIATP